jgi:aconitate hydratase
MVMGVQGGVTTYQPDRQQMSIYDAMGCQTQGVPLLVFAGQENSTGISRDWAAKGLGVRAVVAQTCESLAVIWLEWEYFLANSSKGHTLRN